MTTILFPTRGGQSSFPNQDKVIDLAKELGAHLIFLYVSNVEFLNTVSSAAMVDVVEDELEHMGEFLLAMAQERAEKAGWKADAVVRSGSFTAALREVIATHEVDILALGSPGSGQATTTAKYLEALKERLIKEFNLEVILL